MPLNHEPLSKDEMKTLTDWIDAGAPSADGKVMRADNPNRKKFYVTNQGCDVVTVFDAATLLQMRYIPVGSVTVINYKTLTKRTNIKGTNIAEPHGIGVDDERGLVYVANRNLSGPLPHHSTSCGGRVGFISFIDINTLELLSHKVEVAKDPYSIAVRK